MVSVNTAVRPSPVVSFTADKDFSSNSSAPFTIQSPDELVSFFIATTARHASFISLK